MKRPASSWWVIIVSTALVLSRSAWASPPPPILPDTVEALETCLAQYPGALPSRKGEFFTAKSSNSPPALNSILHGDGANMAVRVCRDMDQNIHYFLSKSGKTPAGVCEIFEEEIFPGDGMATQAMHGVNQIVKLAGWGREMPVHWAAKGYPDHSERAPFAFIQLHPGACPAADDPGYIPAGNVPPGLYQELAQAFERATSSPKSLANVFVGPASFVPFIYDSIRTAHMTSVRCDETDCRADLSNSYTAHFDFRNGGVVITAFSGQPRP